LHTRVTGVHKDPTFVVKRAPRTKVGHAHLRRAKVGGRWYEIGVDGSECEWGSVLAYEPPSRVVLTWQLDGDWAFDPDVAHASEIEVRFIAEGPATTRVELEHRAFERHGAGAESVRKGVSSPDGHEGLLKLFAAAAAA
jgi:uncharacterized protein YndB with AHSA1/START domain